MKYKPEDFIKEYQKLVKKMGYRIVVTPMWRASQDTGDWRLVLHTSVEKVNETRS